MFFPYIKEIASKDLVTIEMNKTIGEAIQKMIQSGRRSIIILDGHFFHMLLANDILTLDQSELNLDHPISKAIIHRLPKINENKNLLESISYLQEAIEYIATVDDEGKLVGLLSHSDIVNSTDPEILMENYSIGEIVKSQKSDIWVQKEDSTQYVLNKMKITHKDCSIIIEEGKPVGIFTIKDVLGLFRDKKDTTLPIARYMTSPVETIDANISIKQAIEFIKTKPFKRLVVVDSLGKIVGMIVQKELISIAYNNWTAIMKQHQAELNEINNMLSNQANRYKHLAAMDPLTNLYNRYKFIELYRTESVAMAQRKQPMSLIMLDIDFFKKINDQYGHNTGDDILKHTAKTLQDSVRNIDIICRWGGEEFVVLLPTVNSHQAMIIAEKLRVHLQENIDVDGVKITASIGLTQAKENDTLEDLVGRADDALYQAKKQGRNCCRLFEDSRL